MRAVFSGAVVVHVPVDGSKSSALEKSWATSSSDKDLAVGQQGGGLSIARGIEGAGVEEFGGTDLLGDVQGENHRGPQQRECFGRSFHTIPFGATLENACGSGVHCQFVSD